MLQYNANKPDNTSFKLKRDERTRTTKEHASKQEHKTRTRKQEHGQPSQKTSAQKTGQPCLSSKKQEHGNKNTDTHDFHQQEHGHP